VVLAKNEYRPGRPTVLFYGHYDVQPPEPLDKWTTPAFEAHSAENDAGVDAVYARGAVDDKGQVWAHVQAVTPMAEAGGIAGQYHDVDRRGRRNRLGESGNFIKSHRAELKADLALISDTGQFARGVPAITYGLRGLVYCEVFLTGPSHDLHSGMYGGAVPIRRTCFAN